MASFSSTATWMILLRVAARSSKVPVQPRMSTAMPMAIVLCLTGKRSVVRPRANRTRRKWNQTGQEEDWLCPTCCSCRELCWCSDSLVADSHRETTPTRLNAAEHRRGLRESTMQSQKGQMAQGRALLIPGTAGMKRAHLR